MVAKIWDDPEIFSIEVELPQNPLRNLNVYVLRDGGQYIVIDTGFNRDECREKLWAGLDEIGIDLSQTILFLTHLHSDHTGLVWDFVSRGVPVYMNPIDHAYFSETKRGIVWPYMENLFMTEGYPESEIKLQATHNQGRLFAPEKIYPVNYVKDGDYLPTHSLKIRCVHTPGHTPGHTALYLPDHKLLFTGDHILFDITPNISVWKGVSHSLSDYLNSLEKIKNLEVQAAFPAHRGVHKDLYTRIEELIKHHEERLEEMYAVVAENPGITAYDVAGKCKWSSRGAGWEDFPPHHRWFAVGETLAHLYNLEESGRIVRRLTENVYRYSAV